MSVNTIYSLVADRIAYLAGAGGGIPGQAMPLVSGFASSNGTLTIDPTQGSVQRFIVGNNNPYGFSTYAVAASTPQTQQVYDFYNAGTSTVTVNFGNYVGASTSPNISGYRTVTSAGLPVTPSKSSMIAFQGLDGTSLQELYRTTGL